MHKSIQVRAGFKAELTLKSTQDGLILLGTTHKFIRQEKLLTTQNLHKLVAIVSNYRTHSTLRPPFANYKYGVNLYPYNIKRCPHVPRPN